MAMLKFVPSTVLDKSQLAQGEMDLLSAADQKMTPLRVHCIRQSLTSMARCIMRTASAADAGVTERCAENLKRVRPSLLI
jgi:hypothetical protein